MEVRLDDTPLESPPHSDLPAAYYYVAAAKWINDRLRRKVLTVMSMPGPAGVRFIPVREADPARERARRLMPSLN